MSQVRLRKKENIGILQIERPETLNALSREIVNEIGKYVEIVDKDDEIKVLILYSKDNFATGADINEMVNCTPQEAKSFAFTWVFKKLYDLAIPTIAAIEGYALGGGLELALTCDLRIADINAKMGFPEVTIGIMPGAGGNILAPRLIGEAKAKDLIFTGRTVKGKEALALGLVNECVEVGQVYERAYRIAEGLAKNSSIAIKTTKRTIAMGMAEKTIGSALEMELENWSVLFETADQKEGMKAFLEKRAAKYIGR